MVGEGSNDGFPILKSRTYEKAKEAAPGYDIYYLEEEWLDFWVTTGKPEIRNPDAAFIAFCSKRYERNPNP